MIGEPKTREQIQQETGLKGKELTAYLRTILAGGGYIKRLAYVDPARSSRRVAVYQTKPKNMNLDLQQGTA